MRGFACGIALVALVACGRGGGGVPSTGTTSGAAAPVSLNRVALYQGVEVTLVKNGEVPTGHQAPVVAGRPALVRVFVGDLGGERTLEAGFALSSGEEFLANATLSADSSRAELDSTVNIEVPDGIAADSEWSVEIRDRGAVVARYPDSGTAPLDAQTGGGIEVVLVPVRYQFDGSDRLPDTSPAVVQQIEDVLGAVFPVEDVMVSVGDTLDWAGEVTPFNGGDWADLLTEVSNLHDRAAASHQTFYMGLFEPTDDPSSWCDNGCILSLSHTPVDPADDWSRTSVMTTSDATFEENFAYSIGFNFGLKGAPGCSQPNVDLDYPYSEGSMGSWGYDRRTGTLLDPATHGDTMSYCSPRWISDYQYDQAFQKLQALHAL